MRKIRLSLKFLSYFFSAKSRFRIHSPFILKFIDNVIKKKNYIPALNKIEVLRNELLKNNKSIDILDLGSGSEKKSEKYTIKVRDIAKNHLKGRSEAMILYNLVSFYKPKNILELGTSLGISTLYLSSANPQSKIITIEGSPETAYIAKENFNKLTALNINSLVGSIDDNIDNAFQLLENRLDLVFFDANHKKEPTLNYFKKCIPFSNKNSIFVFDDIYFSEEMEIAWHEIINHQKVILTIDIFSMGFVFFDNNIAKQNIRFRS